MRGTVLIIEDDRRIANWVRVYFERAGFSAEVAHDGESGLALARELAPDLVILDLMLPRLDGVEVCKNPAPRVGRSHHYADRQGGPRRARSSGLDSGADDYVVKPFDPGRTHRPRPSRAPPRQRPQFSRVLTGGGVTLNETTGMRDRRRRTRGDLSKAQTSLLLDHVHAPPQPGALSRDQLIALSLRQATSTDSTAPSTTRSPACVRQTRPGMADQPIQTVYGAGYKIRGRGRVMSLRWRIMAPMVLCHHPHRLDQRRRRLLRHPVAARACSWIEIGERRSEPTWPRSLSQASTPPPEAGRRRTRPSPRPDTVYAEARAERADGGRRGRRRSRTTNSCIDDPDTRRHRRRRRARRQGQPVRSCRTGELPRAGLDGHRETVFRPDGRTAP